MYFFLFFQKLSDKIWIDFISKKDCHHVDCIRQFVSDYAMFPLTEILDDTGLTDFEKERKLHNMAIEVVFFKRVDKDLMNQFMSFDIEMWKYFVKKFATFQSFNFNIQKMIIHVKNWATVGKKQFPNQFKNIQELPEMQIEKACLKNIQMLEDGIKDIGRFYIFRKDFDEICLQNINTKNYHPINSCIIQNFTNEKCHFENDIFYYMNQSPYHLIYKKEQNEVNGTEYYTTHLENIKKANWFEGIMYLRWNEINEHYKAIFLQYFDKLVSSREYYQHFFLKLKKESIHDILKTMHNLEGRMNPKYPLCSFHRVFGKTKQFFLTKELYNSKQNYNTCESSLFPEFDMQEDSIKQKLNDIWSISFDYFKDSFRCIMENKPIPTCFEKPIHKFKHVEIQNPLVYLIDNFSETQFINEETIFLPFVEKKNWNINLFV